MTAAQEAAIRAADENIKRILDGDSQGNSVALLLMAHAHLMEALVPDMIKRLEDESLEFEGRCYSCTKWGHGCVNPAECYPA